MKFQPLTPEELERFLLCPVECPRCQKGPVPLPTCAKSLGRFYWTYDCSHCGRSWELQFDGGVSETSSCFGCEGRFQPGDDVLMAVVARDATTKAPSLRQLFHRACCKAST